MISLGVLDRGPRVRGGRGGIGNRGWKDWCGSVRGGAVLALMMLALYLPGFFSLPVVDRDEARFAQASRQMMERGDLVVPMVLGKPRLNKPPVVYWLQCASGWVLTGGGRWGDAIWMYRVPSLLAGVGSVLLTWTLGRRLFDARAAWLAGLLLGACPIMFWEAHQARADMLLVGATVLAQWRLWEALAAARRGRPTLWRAVVLWLAVGLGVMVKGPVTPLLVVLAVVGVCLLERSWRALWAIKPWLGLVIVPCVALPWVLLVMERVGGATYWQTIYDEVLGRSLEPKEGHDGPALYHAALAAVLFWPGSLLLWYGLTRAFKVGLRGDGSREVTGGWARRVHVWLSTRVAGRPQEAFLLAWLLPGWWVFEVVSTKLPHYTMPLYPALALLCARAGLSGAAWLREAGRGRLIRTLGGAWSLVGLGLIALAAGLGWIAVRDEGRGAVIAGGAIVGAAFGLMAWFHIKCQQRLRLGGVRGMLPLGLMVFAAVATGLGWAMPHVQELWVSRRVTQALHRLDPEGTRPFAASVFVEDSLIFESHGRVECMEVGDLDDWRDENVDGVMLIPAQYAAQRGWRALASVSGLNYTKGARVDLVLVSPKGRGREMP